MTIGGTNQEIIAHTSFFGRECASLSAAGARSGFWESTLWCKISGVDGPLLQGCSRYRAVTPTSNAAKIA